MGTDKDIKPNIYDSNYLTEDFLIRNCTFDDLDFVKAVNEKELPEDYPFFFYKSIFDNFPESFLVACPKDNPQKIIGYIMWRVEKIPSKYSLRIIHKGHLVSIAVLERYRRKGIASALLLNTMPVLKKHNIKEYVLEVRISNYNAINLYQKFNFNIETVKKNYYKDGENAYYMILKIDEF